MKAIVARRARRITPMSMYVPEIASSSRCCKALSASALMPALSAAPASESSERMKCRLRRIPATAPHGVERLRHVEAPCGRVLRPHRNDVGVGGCLKHCAPPRPSHRWQTGKTGRRPRCRQGRRALCRPRRAKARGGFPPCKNSAL